MLWREAANRIFTAARESVVEEASRNADADPSTIQRNINKAYVRFVAKHPELFRFMVEEGKQSSPRIRWLVDTHLKLMFAVRPICKRLTGIDPKDNSVIEKHAEYVAGLLVP